MSLAVEQERTRKATGFSMELVLAFATRSRAIQMLQDCLLGQFAFHSKLEYMWISKQNVFLPNWLLLEGVSGLTSRVDVSMGC